MTSLWRRTYQSVDGAYLSYPGAFVELGRGQFHEGAESGLMSDSSVTALQALSLRFEARCVSCDVDNILKSEVFDGRVH